MKKNKYNNHPSDYLNKLEEWNDHQYDKGYWSGDNMPPHVNKERLSKLYGKFFLLIGLLLLLMFVGAATAMFFYHKYNNSVSSLRIQLYGLD